MGQRLDYRPKETTYFLRRETLVATEKDGSIAGFSNTGCGSTIRVVDGPWWFKFTWESKNWSMRTFKWCPGGFILCRREAFTEIGGFPEDYYIFEDWSLLSG